MVLVTLFLLVIKVPLYLGILVGLYLFIWERLLNKPRTPWAAQAILL